MSEGSEPLDPALDLLVATLDLEELDRDIFRGTTPPTPLQRVFGGQVAGQALVAAQRTVTDRAVHSLHAYFLRPGATDRPIIYQVDRIRDGRSFTTRRVVAIQNGKAIFNLQASFQVVEDGYDHQPPLPPDLPPPDSLPRWRFWANRQVDESKPPPWLPFDLRLAGSGGGFDRLLWIRTVGRLADDPMLHRCVAAYASDLTLLQVTIPGVAHPEPDVPAANPTFLASLDHGMWFHRPFRVDEWLLYAQSWASSSSGRGLAEGRLFCADGRLAVSVLQEGVVRL